MPLETADFHSHAIEKKSKGSMSQQIHSNYFYCKEYIVCGCSRATRAKPRKRKL